MRARTQSGGFYIPMLPLRFYIVPRAPRATIDSNSRVSSFRATRDRESWLLRVL